MKRLIPLLTLTLLFAASASAQDDTPWTTLEPGSDNITVEGHIPLGGILNTMDREFEH